MVLGIPCNEMLAQLLILYNQETNPKKKDILSTITKFAEELLHHSHMLLNVLHDNFSLTSTVKQEFDLEQLVNKTITKAKPTAEYKGLDLFHNFQYNITNIVIGDSYKIQAILDQLVSNAVKFTEEGKIIITVNLFPSTITNDNRDMVLQFVIHDTGIGISEEMQQYIREKHTKLDFVTKYKGLGLGLSLVKKLIDEINGDIEVVSKEGKSTTTTCNIPVKLPKPTSNN